VSPAAPLGLYLHIPFCSAICNYCNFNRGLFDADLKVRYVAALADEIRQRGDGAPTDTIFFGGGTPSLLDAAEIGALIQACRGAFAVSPDAEVTLEANPESVTADSLAGYRDAGVTRLSFGVQSFRDDELKRLSRLHSAERASQAVALARQAGFDNLSLDLMMWLPQQTVAQWLESVDALVRLEPEHASMYMLEIYPNAPLRDEMARGRWSVAPDDDAADMYEQGLARMDAAGYRQYEISNVALPGRESRHNLKYWSDGEWCGFGAGAHSTRAAVRTKNVSAVSDYLKAVAGGAALEAERREMTASEQVEEALFTGLRLGDGVNLRLMEERYGVDVWATFGSELQAFVDQGLLIYDGASLRLTRQGMLLAHEVMAVFIRSSVR
jgi:oxygen-independent coproporphyrinogen-3 oxidase